MDIYALSDKGRRNKNEDEFIAEKINEYHVLAVADGIGGHRGGEYASKIAIGELRESIKRKGIPGLEEGFSNANSTIHRENERRNGNMGTTLVACLSREGTDTYHIAHVGDSRAYIFNKQVWRTQDHNLIQELLEKGVITKEEAKDHPQKNIVTRALGLEPSVEIDFYKKTVPHAIVLLCSDGLSNVIDYKEMDSIVRTNDAETACTRLMNMAMDSGSDDNITVIVGNNTRRDNP